MQPWYQLEPSLVLYQQGTDVAHDLSEAEAAHRLIQHGPNAGQLDTTSPYHDRRAANGGVRHYSLVSSHYASCLRSTLTVSTPDDFARLKPHFIDPIQHHYEVIRWVVLLGETIAARSQQTGVAPAQISDKARRFVTGGMFAFADGRADHAGRPAHDFPEPIAATILCLKQLYPPIHSREIVRIVERKHGYTTNHTTVKRFLGRHPIPARLPLNWTTFHQFDDAYRARGTVVRMWAEGWSKISIAGCMGLSRKHVHMIVAAFQREGFAGLPPTHPPTRPPGQPIDLALPQGGARRATGLPACRSLSGAWADGEAI